jgi:hypothetical protein
MFTYVNRIVNTFNFMKGGGVADLATAYRVFLREGEALRT